MELSTVTRLDRAQVARRDAICSTLLTRTHGRPGDAVVPEETAFGILSRYHVLTGHTSAGQTMTAIAGRRTISPSTSFPNGLSAMLAHLDLPFPSVADLISRHTILPYFQLFTSPAQYGAAMQSIAKSDAASTKISLGILASRLGAQERLQYCPVCAKEDEDMIGTPTWYRVHQLPGVYICPYHGAHLQRSERLVGGRQRFQLFLPDVNEPQSQAAVKIDSSEVFSRLLLLARLSAQTFDASGFAGKIESLRAQYMSHLQHLGLASSWCRVRQRELHERFMQYWAPLHSIEPFRRLLDLQKNNDTSWLATLCRKHRCAHHPLKHLLLIGFLVDDLPGLLFHMVPSSSPVIERPANSIDKALTTLVLQQGMSLSQAAKVLHVSKDTALAHAQRLQLPVKRRPKKMTQQLNAQIMKALASGAKPQDVASACALSASAIYRVLRGDSALQQYRAHQAHATRKKTARTNVLNILNSSRKIGMKALRILLPADVMWLYRHDRQWLMQNVAPTPTQKKAMMRVDWGARDMLMCQRIRKAVAELLRVSGKPTRVSLNELGRRTGHASWLDKKLDKLPKTRELLPTVLEPVEAFQQRRYRWWQEKLTGTTMYGEAAESRIRRAAGLPATFKPNQ